MCTVTVIPLDRGIRLITNRDENRERAAAKPPEIRQIGLRRVLMPIDPESDGTWIAVNDAGLVMTLLNVNPPRGADRPGPTSAKLLSRGTIIPSLMAAGRLDDAIESAAAETDATRMRPFRLIMSDGSEVAELRSGGDRMQVTSQVGAGSPVMFTSSGLGDHIVEPPRRALFEVMFASTAPADLQRLQEEFHRHCWPDQREVSVNMERAEARTVSVTIVTLGDRTARMSYFNGVPEHFDGGATSELRLAPNLAA
jgi:hypothetical protein